MSFLESMVEGVSLLAKLVQIDPDCDVKEVERNPIIVPYLSPACQPTANHSTFSTKGH